ncbi:ankyrin repeat domain-containing protein [Pseudoduganella ginsengisoli]|uniref:Uncharacterized protein n=1 Tax=Pseudoduganella ginsengisoli TaxID=1462440 RepID=A0A6L6PYQ6_9BURK|nr:ankyrin repeat domain-containing protein [Pseudoduganella ginsengisoli]MTW02687.1 hypothetical protein [Pseudoduganella ginsengisoli]
MMSEIVKLAYQGKWHELLPYLDRQPELINARSSKGYTPLHQAAWHGANRHVVWSLLNLGADTSLRTLNGNQSAAEIAVEKHPEREDLHFLLQDNSRTPTQLLRKLIAEKPALFDAYDGNRLLCDRVIETLYSGDRQRAGTDIEETLLTSIRAAAGSDFFQLGSIDVGSPPINMMASTRLWLETIVPTVIEMSSKAYTIPLAPSYAVMADLFDPIPSQWGFRGDPFLWMEMAHALCHVPIPKDDSVVELILRACFTSLTGAELRRDQDLTIPRFARGGMSSGMISGESWTMSLIPKLRQRAQWLNDVWSSDELTDI